MTLPFADRKLKDEYDWNGDIYRNLKEFLLTNTSNRHAYQILMDAHISIAFAAGRILDSKSGVNIFPVQKSSTNGTVLWDVKLSSKKDYAKWEILHERFNENQYDSALVLNVSRDIYNDVVKFIKERDLSIGRIINCKLNGVEATNFSIEDGTHATILANSVYSAIGKRSIMERRATLHIFASAPTAFMFSLGQNSSGFGNCILYEYDFELKNSCTYSQSISFTN
ncbi:SAVED domain-containing protein [[Clostridium] scindens]|uniref:SAVED domain-containing protein n=1 Tax=Clostridium scindens (strain JCM 10418 / VPI 12708) TaxID=29347 RepID=UPI00242BB021|nr:SAVED domain-containing protein [[Clostridium] scindens]